MESGDFDTGKAGSLAARANARAKETLVGIDVPDTVQQALIEQCGFDGGLSAAKQCPKLRQHYLQRLLPGSDEQLARWQFCCFDRRGMDAHAAEATSVHEAKFAT